jgi:hypothetical protein
VIPGVLREKSQHSLESKDIVLLPSVLQVFTQNYQSVKCQNVPPIVILVKGLHVLRITLHVKDSKEICYI